VRDLTQRGARGCVSNSKHFASTFLTFSGDTYEELAFRHKQDSSGKYEAFFHKSADIIARTLKQMNTFVTGGFKTVGAMVKALQIVDGVGLARPLCQEPRLCVEILAGNFKGAIMQLPDQSNYALTSVVAGTQMQQIGKDKEPIDLSKEGNEMAFKGIYLRGWRPMQTTRT